MGYPSNLLTAGEHIELDQHAHWSGLVVKAWWALLVVVGVFAAWVGGYLSGARGYMGGIVGICGALVLGWRALDYFSTDFVVSSMRIIWRRGVVTRSSQEILLDRVTNISVRRNPAERALGSGTLIVESAGKDGQTKFTDIAQVERVQRLILERIEARRGGVGPQVQIDVAGQLVSLSELHAQGRLSDDEFARAKARVLGQG